MVAIKPPEAVSANPLPKPTYYGDKSSEECNQATGSEGPEECNQDTGQDAPKDSTTVTPITYSTYLLQQVKLAAGKVWAQLVPEEKWRDDGGGGGGGIRG